MHPTLPLLYSPITQIGEGSTSYPCSSIRMIRRVSRCRSMPCMKRKIQNRYQMEMISSSSLGRTSSSSPLAIQLPQSLTHSTPLRSVSITQSSHLQALAPNARQERYLRVFSQPHASHALVLTIQTHLSESYLIHSAPLVVQPNNSVHHARPVRITWLDLTSH